MIYLYDSTETDFRYNGKPLPTAYDVTVSNTLNSEYYVMGKYPLDKDKVYKEIVEDRIIKVHTMDGMQPFRIINVSKQELYVEFEAWPLFYADMRNKLVKPLNLKRVSGQTALNSFKNNLLIDTPFDFYSDITDNHDYRTQDENERENNPKQLYNALDVFKTIVSRWGGELWIRGYDVRVNKRIGTDTEAMLYEKKNITEFVDTTNIEGIVTRLHGKSEWQDERQEGEEEGKKHLIETTVNSPLINNYSGVVFEKQYTNNDIRTEQELKNWLNLKFTTENIDKPQRTIEVGTNVIDGTKIGFADTLILKYIKHDTDARIKVVGYEYDGFANELKHVVLGQPKHTSSSTIGNTITDLVNNVVDPVDRKTTIAMSSADGKSTVFHGTADPNTLNLNAKENDTYFRTNGSEKEIWRFTGTLWVKEIDTSDTTKNADAIAEQQQEIEEAKQTADEAVGQIDTAVANAGFTSLDEAMNDLGTVSSRAEAMAALAKTTGERAITDASNAQAKANTAHTNALKGISDASTAKSTADTAQTNALKGISDAKKAQTDATEALSGVTGVDTRLTNELVILEDELSNKISTTEHNALKGTVTTQGTKITQNTTAITSKADKTVVDTLTGTVSSQGTRLTQSEKVIKLKASQSEVDTVKGRVTSAEAAITVNAQGIASKVSREDVDDAIDGIEVGGRNLATHSKFEANTKIYGGSRYNDTVTLNHSDINNSFVVNVKSETDYILKVNGNGLFHRVDEIMFDGGGKARTVVSYLTYNSNRTETEIHTNEETEQVWVTLHYNNTPDNMSFDETKFKFEKGNKATDWSPAPEDIQGAIVKNETSIVQNSTAITSKADKSVVDTLSGTVSTQGTKITQNANAITTKAATSTVNALTGRVSTAEANITTQAGQISSKVSQAEVDASIDGIEVGGRNLLPYFTSNRWDIVATIIDNYYIESSPNDVFLAEIALELEPRTEYTFAFNTENGRYYFYDHSEGTRGDVIHSSASSNTDSVVNTFTTGEETSVLLRIGNWSQVQGDTRKAWDIKLEKGNKATDWTPAPEDTTTLINHVESELTQKHDTITATVSSIDGRVATNKLNLDGLTTTVQDVKSDLTGTTTLLNSTRTTVSGHTSSIATLRTDVNGKATTAQFNTLNSTVNGTITRVGNAEGKITQIETNVNGLQTTVASKASQSQVTQLATLVDTKVTSSQVNSLIRSDKSIKDTRDANESPEWYYDNYSSETVREFKRNKTLGISGEGNYGILETIIPWTDSSGGGIKQTFTTDYSVWERSGTRTTWGKWKKTADVDWVGSQISVLEDNINLRVTKGELLSQINIEAERTLIQSNRLLLNANNTVITGTAWMDGAVIKNASMDGAKIQDATIGSAKIANIDANKITTGELKGIRAEIDEGLIGGWDLSNDRISKLTPYGYTLLKPGGLVALATSSPQNTDAGGAVFQIYHDGRLSFLNDNGLYSYVRPDNSGGSTSEYRGLVISSGGYIYLDPGATVELNGRLLPSNNGQLHIGESNRRFRNIYSNSFRTWNGVMQNTANDNLELYSDKSVHFNPNNNITRNYGHFRPGYTNSYWLGNTEFRWLGLYLSGGSVNESSDARLKDDIRNVPKELINQFKNVQPKEYKMDGQTHYGYIAQDVERALFKYATNKYGVEKARKNKETFNMVSKDDSYLALVYRQVTAVKQAENEYRFNRLEIEIDELKEKLEEVMLLVKQTTNSNRTSTV